MSAITALDEPIRRRLYEFAVGQPAPVSRDEAAEAVGAPRATVAFHLDKLVAEGLLEVVYERRTGRTGPGAGRPSKLYRRSSSHITVSLPERRYELAARLMASALESSGEPPRDALRRCAHEFGKSPFDSVAQQHTELVCGMNLGLIDGVLDGLGVTGVTARLEPQPGQCCVQLTDRRDG